MKQIKCIHIAAVIAIIAVTILSIFFSAGGGVQTVHASASGYSEVLDDLRKDKSFDTAKYPAIDNDGKLEVIQIAESTAGELFLYVYQPSGGKANLRATTVRLSRTKGDNYSDYNLTYLNSNGVFYKYLVQWFKVVNSETVRYYDIAAIHRKFDAKYDTPHGDDGQTIDETAFKVGQVWETTTGADGAVTYKSERTDVVKIKDDDKMIGFRRLLNGGAYWSSFEACDAHFIAFNCDHAIDELYAADVSFVSQAYRTSITGTTRYDPEPHTLPLKGEQKVKNKPYGAFGQEYEWKRIQSVEEFLQNSGLDDEQKNEISKYSWVLNFYETEWEGFNGVTTAGLCLTAPGLWAFIIPSLLGTNTSGTVVSEVSVLYLEFQTDGITYSLGVVDNKQTGPGDPFIIDGGVPLWVWIVFGAVTLITFFLLIFPLIKGKPMLGASLAFVFGVGMRFLLGWLAADYVSDLTAVIPLLNLLCVSVSIIFGIPLIIKLIKLIAGGIKRRKARKQAKTLGSSDEIKPKRKTERKKK